MITIISDPYHYQQPAPTDVCATSVEDYVPIRQAIRRALDVGRRLTVYVTHPSVLAWLSDLRGYGADMVAWHDVDPAKTFSAVFGFAPPPLFTAPVILALELESLPCPQNGVVVEPVAWILGARLGGVWNQSTPSTQHLALLVNTIVADSAPIDAALIPLLSQQLAVWTQDQPDYAGLRAPTLFADAKRYLLRWAIQRYDSQLWGDAALVLTPILVHAPDPTICRTVLAEHERVISSYWNRWFARHQPTTDSLTQALGQMSGLSEIELTAVSHVLERQPPLLTPELLAALRQTFVQLPAAASALAEWKTRVPPPPPPLPDAGWTTDRWIRWATAEYLPYFEWIVRTDQPRDNQQQLAAQWSDWLYTQYPTWLNQVDSPLLLRQYAHMRDIIDRDQHAVVLWLVVDGLTWWQGALLKQKCVVEGLHLADQRAGIAVLPSITSVSKRALVTGVAATRHDPQPIADAAAAHLSHSGISNFVTYQPDAAITHLGGNTTTRCYVVLNNRLDQLAHSTPTFTDDAGIQGSLQEIAQLAARMSRRAAAQGRTLHILVGSDHGSTRLPATAIALRLPPTTREFDEWEAAPNQTAGARSTRAAIIVESERLTEREQAQWYLLDRDRFQLNNDYLVPCGYNYIGRRPSGWTHGGLSPEEVVVPLLHFTAQAAPHEPVAVLFSGELEAFRESALTVTISNPNRQPLQAVTLRLVVGLTIHIEQIGASATHEQTVQLPVNTTQAKEQIIEWTLTYAILGVNHAQTGQQTLSIRRLQTQDTAFDELFD